MPDANAPESTAALIAESVCRKPWQAPEIEDVSVVMKTAKKSSSTEYGSGKQGS